MVQDTPPIADLARALESVLQDAALAVARVVAVHRDMAAHIAHPGIGRLKPALHEVADVLVRFDLPSVAASAVGFTLAGTRRQATDDFDNAFDDALGKVHAARREAGRVGLAAAARGAVLGPHVVHLRRELNTLHRHAVRADLLLDKVGLSLAREPAGSETFATAALLARRARLLGEMHDCGRDTIDAIRECEEAFGALLVRLKHELAPTYVEWKRLLAPVAMRAFSAQATPLDLPEAREVHALLQRQVRVACDAASEFESACRELGEAVLALGRRAPQVMERLGDAR